MIETYKNFNKETPVFETSTEYVPESAVCTALAYAGHTMPLGLFSKACDSLGDFMKTDESIENFYKNTAPTLYGDYRAKMPGYFRPSEVLSVLIFGTNQWLKKDILKFEKMTQNEILDELDKGNPIIVVASNNGEHRLVPLLGYEHDSEDHIVLNLPKDCAKVFERGFTDTKPFNSDSKWVITIAPAEPVI